MRAIFKCLVLASTVLVWASSAQALEEIKSASLQRLQELRNREAQSLRKINDNLSQKMDDSTSSTLDDDMDALKTQQHEHLLRQEFLDRLIFQVDTKFRGGDMREFLQRTLIDMAKVDAVSSLQNDQGLWKFLKYSADAIHRLPEQKENVLAFLEGYMNRSISDPVLPQEYLATRNYSNGSASESGKPVSREDAGAIADRRVQEMDKAAARAAAK